MSLPPEPPPPTGGRYHVQQPADQTLDLGTSPPPASPLPGTDAETHFKVAEMLLARGNFRAAVLEAQKGMKLRAPRPEQRALYAWLLYQRSGAGSAVHPHVWDHLAAALLADPSCAAAHYFKGMLLVRIGRAPEAVDHLSRALELDPQHQDARRELRLLGQRSLP
jgi:tetratricopeptide (TPR) repeat protein